MLICFLVLYAIRKFINLIKPCLLKLLKKYEDKELTPQEVNAIINPLGLNNFHYLCKTCGLTMIPGYGSKETPPLPV